MSDRKNDRHKAPRICDSGAEKRKKVKEKQKRDAEIFAQTPKLNNFFHSKTPELGPAENLEEPV